MTARLYSLVCSVILLVGCSSTPTRTIVDDMDDIYAGNLTAEMLGVSEAGSFDDAMTQGNTAFRRGETDKAAAYFVRAIELASEDKKASETQQIRINEAGLRLANLYQQQGMQSQAENVFLMLLNMDDNQVEALEAMGLMRLNQRRISQAKDYLARAISVWYETRSESDSYTPVRSLNGLAVMADLEENYDKAGEYYRRALSLSPDDWQLMNNLGYSLYLSGDWTSAEYWYSQSLNRSPDYDLAIRNLALLKTRQKKYQGALTLLEKMMSPWEAVHDVAFMAMLANDLESAESMFEQAIDLSPSFYVEAWTNLQQLRKRI